MQLLLRVSSFHLKYLNNSRTFMPLHLMCETQLSFVQMEKGGKVECLFGRKIIVGRALWLVVLHVLMMMSRHEK